jgi:hypothetical protein
VCVGVRAEFFRHNDIRPWWLRALPVSTHVPKNLIAIGQLATGRWRIPEQSARRVAAIRAQHPFGGIPGAVDIVANEQTAVLLHGLRYVPRPVFQSYQANTPMLAELNARHFRGPGAPDHVLVGPNTIDDHYPTLDDAPVRLELLRAYDLKEMRGAYLLLRRRATPRAVRLTPFDTVAVPLAPPRTVPVPAADAVWATLTFEQTTVGKLSTFLYKAPQVVARVTFAGGREREFRIVPGMSSNGFLLSPAAGGDAIAPFAALVSGHAAGGSAPRVVAIRVRVRSARPALFFAPTARLALFTLSTAPGAAARSAGAAVQDAADCVGRRTRLGCTVPGLHAAGARARVPRRAPAAVAAIATAAPLARPTSSLAR